MSSLAKSLTDAFSAAIDAVRKASKPDPKRKIHAFLGPAGYGKTHLFGRINHQHGDQIYFVFIPAITGLDGVDKDRQLESSLRWRLVESLLHSTQSFAPLRIQLAQLLAPSFCAYFDSLSAGLKLKCDAIRENLESDPLTVLELLSHVDGLGAYHLLADAVRDRLRHCSGSVVRALVLGTSPAADDARWWLRGEADQIPEARLAALHLPAESPPLIDVLKAVAEILRLMKTPLVVCFDQLEELFKNDREGFTSLTAALMSWLQTVPNLVIGIGCLNATWNEVSGLDGFKSFFRSRCSSQPYKTHRR